MLRLSPSFVRASFTGEGVEWFGRDLLDQRIKLVFPITGLGFAEFGLDGERTDPEWYRRWRDLPDASRNPIRTYTIRAVRPELAEIDIDFVDHGPIGPAGRWLGDAAPGSELIVVGPDARSAASAAGIDWHPGPATSVLLAGDETAAPAISSILEILPRSVSAAAFIEVPSEGDTPAPSRNADAIRWLPRGDAPHGTRLETEVRRYVDEHQQALHLDSGSEEELPDVDVDRDLLWEAPEDATRSFYAWIAGESALVRSLRRFLVRDVGVDRHQVAFMGYWRAGRAEGER